MPNRSKNETVEDRCSRYECALLRIVELYEREGGSDELSWAMAAEARRVLPEGAQCPESAIPERL